MEAFRLLGEQQQRMNEIRIIIIMTILSFGRIEFLSTGKMMVFVSNVEQNTKPYTQRLESLPAIGAAGITRQNGIWNESACPCRGRSSLWFV